MSIFCKPRDDLKNLAYCAKSNYSDHPDQAIFTSINLSVVLSKHLKPGSRCSTVLIAVGSSYLPGLYLMLRTCVKKGRMKRSRKKRKNRKKEGEK